MSITLTAQVRDTKAKKAKDLLREGRVPCVLYGFQVKNQPLECVYQELHKTFVKAGENTIVQLNIGDKTIPVLIHSLSFDPVSGAYEHVDFFALNMNKEVTANIPVRAVNDAPGVKDLGGILIRNRDSLEVKCLPKDLPHDIEVDLSTLKNFHDAILVKDLRVGSGVTILDNAEEIVVSLQPPRVEEVEPTPAEGSTVEGSPTEAGEATEETKTNEKKTEEK